MKKTLLFIIVLLLLAYPFLLVICTTGLRGAFGFFASDAYYYFSVAANSIGHNFLTFDGYYPTNGFHPLWQHYLVGLFRITDLIDSSETQVWGAFISSLLPAALGTGLFSLVLLRITRNFTISLIAAVPGVYYLLSGLIRPDIGSSWSFVNGMESPFSILVFSILVFLLFCRELLREISTPKIILLSFILTVLSLCRLDDVFIFAPFFIYLLWRPGRLKKKISRLVIASILPVVILGGYLLYNAHYAGMVFPVSGMVKTGGSSNFHFIIRTLFPSGLFAANQPLVWRDVAWRVCGVLVPTVAAAIWLMGSILRRNQSRQAGSGYESRMIMILCGYVVLKGGYHFIVTYLWHQGHWYFPLSIMIFNLIFALGISSAISKQSSPKLKMLLAVVGVIWVVLMANAFAGAMLAGEEEERCFEFWNSRRYIMERLEPECKSGGIVSFDDGIISYSLEVPVMSGFGFNLDREAYLARARGELLDIAYKRGYRYLASLNYLDLPEAAVADESVLHGYISSRFFLHGQKLARWSFSLVPRNTEKWRLIRFRPRE